MTATSTTTSADAGTVTAVVATVDGMGVLADARDWTGLTNLFTEEVDLDYTSLNGGTPVRLPADDVVAGWTAGLGGLAIRLCRLAGGWRIAAVTMTAVRATGNQHVMALAAQTAASEQP